MLTPFLCTIANSDFRVFKHRCLKTVYKMCIFYATYAFYDAFYNYAFMYLLTDEKFNNIAHVFTATVLYTYAN